MSGLSLTFEVPAGGDAHKKLLSGEVTMEIVAETAQLVVDQKELENAFDEEHDAAEQARVPVDPKDDWVEYLPRDGPKERHCKRYEAALKRLPPGHPQRGKLRSHIDKRKQHTDLKLGARRAALDKEVRERKQAAEEKRAARARALELVERDLCVSSDGSGMLEIKFPSSDDPAVSAEINAFAARMQKAADEVKAAREAEESQPPQ